MESSTGWANDDALIAAATELAATLGEDPNHSVAAAAMDLRGSIYAGVNNRHFNGCPCAELVVLGWLQARMRVPLRRWWRLEMETGA